MDVAQLGMQIRSGDAVTATNRLKKMERQSGRTESAAMRMAKNMKAAFVGVALGAAAMFGGQAVIGTLAGFEKSMAAVAAITRATDDQLAALRDTAKQLGSTTEFSTSQAADGLKFFGMAGWSAAQSIAAIPAILDLATAAQMDLATAADISSNIMTAFGIAAENASAAADVLAAVSSRANTDVTQLGDGMKYVGPVASALGISMGDAAAAMGALSDAGIQGSMAGTSLRRVLSSLANPSKDAARVIKDLQLNVDDLNPATNSIVEIVDRLAEAGLDAADALTIFGDRGGPAILALVENRAKLASLTGELSNVQGEAKRMADTMRDQLGGDIKGLQSALEGLIIQLGESGLTAALSGLIRTMTALARGVTGAIGSFSQFASSIDSVIGVSGTLGGAVSFLINNMDILMAAAIATAAVFSGKFVLALGTKAVGAIATAVTSSIQLQMALGATSVSAALSSVAVKGFSLSLIALRTAVTVLLGPVGIALALIGALTAAIVMNQRETKRLQDIQERYSNLLSSSESALKTATKRMEDYREKTQQTAEKSDVAATKVNELAEAMRTLADVSSGDFSSGIDGAMSAVDAVMGSNISQAIGELNDKYGLQAQLLRQIRNEQSDSGLEGAVLFEAQANKAAQLAKDTLNAAKARGALAEAEKAYAESVKKIPSMSMDPISKRLLAKEMNVQKQAILDARAALAKYNGTLEQTMETNVDAFGGNLLDEQKQAAEVAAQKVQETIAGLQNQLTIDRQVNDLQKEIAANILKAGLAIDDNSIGAEKIRKITTELFNLEVARNKEEERLDKAKKAADTITDLEREVSQLQRLNEALKFGEERYMKVAQAIAIEDFVRRNGIEGLDEEIARITELIRKRDELSAANDNTIAGFGKNDGGMSDTDRTSAKERFQGLGDDLRGNIDNPALRLQAQYEEQLKIVDQYEQAYTHKTAEANAARLAIEQQYQDAKLRLTLSSGEQAAGALAGAFKDTLGEQSAAYKAMFAVQQGFVIATASLNIAKAMSEALALPFPANLSAWAVVATNAAQIMSAINSVAGSFAEGGFTGAGGKYDVAGMVHKGEVVWSQQDVARHGGWQNVDAMRRGMMPAANDNGSAGGVIELGISITVDDEGRLQAYVSEAENRAVNTSVTISDQRTKARMNAAQSEAQRPVISARGAA